MKTMTPLELAQYLRDRESHGATMVTLSALTDANAYKKHNPYGSIRKLNHVNGTIAYHYRNAAAKVGQHEIKPRPWGHHWQGCRSVIEHKGKLYLSLLVKRCITHPLYYVQEGELTKTISAADIAHLLPLKREHLPCVRDYRLDSIKVLKVGGEKIRVVADRGVEQGQR